MMRVDRSSAVRLFSGPLLSAASQLIGALQLLLILVRIGADSNTDAYFYLWTFGMLPVMTLLSGVLYPMLINRARVSRAFLRGVPVVSSVSSVFLVAVAMWWLVHSGREIDSFYLITGLMCSLVLLQNAVWFRAVIHAAHGEPNWLAGIALVPNVFAVVALSLPYSGVTLLILMLMGLVVGNVVTYIGMAYRGVGAVLGKTNEVGVRSDYASFSWFFARSGVSQGGVALLQSLAVLLPPSQLTIANVVVKLVGSGTVTFANAILPRFIHTATDSPAGAMRLMRLLWAFWLLVGVVAVTTVYFAAREYLSLAVLGALWLIASSTSLIAQRLAFRFLPARVSLLPIVSVIAVTVVALLLSITGLLDLLLVLMSFALIEAVSGVVLVVALRDRQAFAVMVVVTVGLIMVPIVG